MIRLYGYDTVNTIKVLMMLEEVGAGYEIVPINIRKGDQRSSSFLSLNPRGKVPVIVDESAPGEPLILTESGAILIYLAESSGFGLPVEPRERARSLEWLAFQLSTQGPTFGQCEFWTRIAPNPIPAVEQHYLKLGKKIFDQIERHLESTRYFSGNQYGIADIAHFAWILRAGHAGLTFEKHRAVQRWFAEVSDRPATIAALKVVEAFDQLESK